jgi:hypothetical protein
LLVDVGVGFNFFFRCPSFDEIERKEGSKEMGGKKKNSTRQLMQLQVEDPQYTNNHYKEPTQALS